MPDLSFAPLLAEHADWWYRDESTAECQCGHALPWETVETSHSAHLDALLTAHVAEVLGSAEVVEVAARAIAELEPGEDWPTNAALGGGLTGTRDDEYRDALHSDARAALAALTTHLTGDTR